MTRFNGADHTLVTPAFWMVLCAAVRLSVLLMLPHQSGLLADRDSGARSLNTNGTPSTLHFLVRRTEFQPLTVDEHCYDEMARNIVAGRGFVLDSLFIINTPGQPAMYAGCGYPLFLAAIYGIFGSGNELAAALIQMALQVASVYWIYRAAQLIAGKTAAAIAAGFFTFHPVAIWASMAIMTEALIVPLAAWMAWVLVQHDSFCAQRPNWKTRALLSGAVLALLCLTRSTCAGLMPIVLIASIFQNRQSHRWIAPFWIAATFVVVCSPWTIRNYVHWKHFIPFSTKSGVNAWFFNHPGLKVEFGRKAVEGSQPIDIFDPEIQNLPDEASRDARLAALFRQFVRDHPLQFLGLCWMRFWMALLPVRITSTTFTALLCAWYVKGVPLAAAALSFFDRSRMRQFAIRTWPLLAMVIYWQLLQSLAGPGMRYRLPVEPVWAVLVGVSCAEAIHSRRAGALKNRAKND